MSTLTKRLILELLRSALPVIVSIIITYIDASGTNVNHIGNPYGNNDNYYPMQ